MDACPACETGSIGSQCAVGVTDKSKSVWVELELFKREEIPPLNIYHLCYQRANHSVKDREVNLPQQIIWLLLINSRFTAAFWKKTVTFSRTFPLLRIKKSY